jgi:hypothetical protein
VATSVLAGGRFVHAVAGHITIVHRGPPGTSRRLLFMTQCLCAASPLQKDENVVQFTAMWRVLYAGLRTDANAHHR